MRQEIRGLTPGWVAGSVRARHMLARRIGRAAARELAGAPSLEAALAQLAGTAYGRRLQPGYGLAEAQRALGETALWHVRVLAGWTPPRALEGIRALAAWFELANIEDHALFLAGGDVPRPFALGGLGTAWDRVGQARTLAALRSALAGSPWGDAGADDPGQIRLALRLAWARRVLAAVDEATDWAAGAVALLVAREPPGIGRAWAAAGSLRALRAALPAQAAWVLEDAREPADLWRADALWWRRVEQEAEQLAHAPLMGAPLVVGCVALLGVDAWRTASALESAARGGTPEATGVYDELG